MTAGRPASVLHPTDEKDAGLIVSRTLAKHRSLGIVGGDTRAGLGRPSTHAERISSAAMSGITIYEPAELIIGAKAGTPVAEVTSALEREGQMLAFEPIDHRRIFGTLGEPTIGGLAATNASGPRRIKTGAARDAMLGVRFINGLGQQVKSGGRVMKNVTGLDLTKLMSGSHGTLGFLTEVTFKVAPKPDQSVTLEVAGLDEAEAIEALSATLASPFEPSGAAHLPAGLSGGRARTLVRVEGFRDSVKHRVNVLASLLGRWGASTIIEGTDSVTLWADIRDAGPITAPRDNAIWRVSSTPSQGPAIVTEIRDLIESARWFFDWGGGLIWLSVPALGDAGARAIRGALVSRGGHATLLRAPDTIRGSVAPLQPLSETAMRLTTGIKRSFDPQGVFERGRMYEGV